ncbi:histidine kinase [Pseudobacter ginsenosidimutans]|uniref:Histidine kinase n=1 Tax=Pseudobacter ginsenosidimutans TaxID=661488 RepID=A0A4Q7N294_9BACT|nr:histidine kinase [Pseudobacter ginsenosidimutans]QEC43995.1 hypothetical protein FSB84_20795 [Pseudobacter ginsenosidimutans]RZS75432.1 histidine kinase [Pseudobacter ginsenosidimutans]
MKISFRIIPWILCLLLFIGCHPSGKDKKKGGIAIKQLDSLYIRTNELITTGKFEQGIVLVREGIGDAAAEKNDSMLSRFYWMANLYFRYKSSPQKDSQQYYKVLADKHAQLSGNKKLQSYILNNLVESLYSSKQYDSAINLSTPAFLLANELKDSIALLDLYQLLRLCYHEKGNPEMEFQYLSRSMDIYSVIKNRFNPEGDDKESKKIRFQFMVLLYSMASYQYDHNDFVKSLAYYNELEAMVPERRKPHNPLIYTGKGNCYAKLGRLDSAYKYLRLALERTDTGWVFRRHRSFAARSYGILLAANGNRKQGEQYLQQSLRLAHESKLTNLVTESQLALADFFIDGRQWQAANGILLAVAKGLPPATALELKIKLYGSLYRVYKESGRYPEALHYYTLVKDHQDSLNTVKAMRTMAETDAKYQTGKKNQQIILLQKNNRIQELQLTEARRLRLFYISGTLLLMTLFGLVYYYRRKLQRRELERVKNELELKALRTQMKPHFIFNCLNAIQDLIVTKDYLLSSQYLSKFSRLLRMVLDMADKNFITLQKEIEICRLYVALEALRLKNTFDYSITVDEKLDVDAILFPTLLVQPYIENAIWHGLSNKKGEKRLLVHFEEAGDSIRCTISDNGIGRIAAGQIKAAKIGAEHFESKGTILAEQRMAMLREGLVKDAFVRIEDRYDDNNIATGTTVIIEIVPL